MYGSAPLTFHGIDVLIAIDAAVPRARVFLAACHGAARRVEEVDGSTDDFVAELQRLAGQWGLVAKLVSSGRSAMLITVGRTK